MAVKRDTTPPSSPRVGFRIFPRAPRELTPEVLGGFEVADVAHVVDAMSGFGAVDPSIRAVVRPKRRAVGSALTVKAHPGDHLMIRIAIGMVHPGDVLVIDCRSDVSVANVGGMVCEQLARRKVAGLLIDGAVRDVAHIERTGLPVFARSATPAPPTMCGPGEINVPVVCGNVVVNPGDVVLLDSEGCVIVPRADALTVLDATKLVASKEEGWSRTIKQGTEVVGMDEAQAVLEREGVSPLELPWGIHE